MIIFDDGLGQLGPIADLRASFEIRTGMYTTAARMNVLRPKTLAGYWVPQRIAAMVAERANAPVNLLPQEEVLLCVNGRWTLPDFSRELGVGEALVEESSGHVIGAALRRADAEYFLNTHQLSERVQIEKIGGASNKNEAAGRVLCKYAWDVIALCKQTIPLDIINTRVLDAQIPTDLALVVSPHPVEIHASARVFPNVVFDAENGPIIVHERAVIRPGAVICGPASIGPDSIIIDRALIKANTVIGPHCKVGGEVGGTIFQGYSNKSHDGHLGDSWIGKWVNLGAGTTNSNLLNTYGEVTMRLEANGPRVRTGMQFLGAIVGDHVKTAIGTRVMTGTVIGTGAMIATTAPPPTTVKRFAWLTDERDSERSFKLEKFLEIMQAVMARRGITPSAAYVNMLRDLHRHHCARLESTS